MFQYSAQVVRVVDGDTIIVDVDLGFRIRIEQVVRLARINAPDVVNMGAGGVVDHAREYIETHCPIGSTLILSTMKAEKYGRWLAEVVYVPGETEPMKVLQGARSLNEELLRAGLVQAYDGGRK